MNTFIRKFFQAYIPVMIAIVILAGCASFNAYYTSPPQCLEGKDYTIQVTVTGQVTGVTLYYSINNAGFKEIRPEIAGAIYQYTIPASLVKQGKIEYYALILDKDGKPSQTETARVRVMSASEGKTQEEADLLHRIRFIGNSKGAITTDLSLAWTINPNPYNASLTLNYRFEGQTGYVSAPLSGAGGEFSLVIPQNELKEGALEYYLDIEERHPDFGTLGITDPLNGATKPATIGILGVAELAEAFTSDTVAGLRHTPVSEAAVTGDLGVSFTFALPASDAYGKTSSQPPTGFIHLLKLKSHLPEKTVPLVASGPITLSGLIDKRNLDRGYDAYYFTFSVKTGKLGTIEITYPVNGAAAPFTFHIVTVKELKDRQQNNLAGGLSHVSPGQITGLDPVVLMVQSRDPKQKLIGVLHVQKPGATRFEDIKMTPSPQGLTGVITEGMIKDGYTLYYFTVSASFDELGQLSVDLKKDSKPYSLTLASKQPTDKDKQPTDKDKQPTDKDKQPTDKDKQPTDKDKQPTDKDKQPTDKDKQPTDKDKQPTDKDKQPTDKDKQPTDKDKQPTDKDKQPTDKDKQPSDKDKQPSDKDKQPTDKDKQPTDKDKQPTDKDKQPTDKDKQPTDKDKRPTGKDNNGDS